MRIPISSRSWVRVFAALAALATSVAAEGFVSGRVTSPFGLPIAGAGISDGSNNATSDVDGWFTIGQSATVRNTGRLSQVVPVFLRGSRISIAHTDGTPVSLYLFDCLGRAAVSMPHLSAHDQLDVDLRQHTTFASGVYVLQVRTGSRHFTAKAVVSGRNISWQSSGEMASGAVRSASAASRLAYGNLTISATGYAQRQFSVSEDVAIAKEFTLYYPGQSVPTTTVSMGEEDRSNRIAMQNSISETYQLKWANNSTVRCYESVNWNDTTKFTVGYHVLTLDNGLIAVTVCPELGSRILRVYDKTVSPARDLFATPFESDLMSGTKFGNLGGVKAAFPFHENSTGLISYTGEKKFRSGYFVDTHPDGSMSITMNMRFDYNQLQEDCAFLGKYGDRSLNTVVTVKPGSSALTVRYIADNPNPIRRNNRLWCDAIFPRNQTSWIFPTKWGMQHCASEIWDMSGWNGSDDFSSTHSYFALYPQYGFAGAYYSGAGTSHIRATDPVKAPGMKVYHQTTIPELWSSTNALFEAPEGFVNAFEPNDMTLRFYLTRGVGKASFANEQVALSANGSQFSLTSPWPGIVSVYNYNATSSPIIASRRIGPDTVLTGTFSQGVRVVAADGTVLCNVQLPLQYTDNRSAYTAVKDRADRYGCVKDVSTLNATFGTMCELSDLTTLNSRLTWLASLLRTANFTAGDDADILLSMAYAAYNVGGFTQAEDYLTKVGTRKPAESAYLRALMALETAQTPNFSAATIEGNYFKALAAVKGGNTAAAISDLNALLTARPNAIRPRLLRAYLTGNYLDIAEAAKRVPGSLEMWTVLKQFGASNALANYTGLLAQDAMATTRAADFIAEITQGQWRHERRFEYDKAWFERASSMPLFPAALKY